MKRFPFVASLAALAGFSSLAGFSASAWAQDRPVDLSEVEVRGVNTVILRVKVSGDMGPGTVVLGDVAGINCGPAQYLYTPHENRQCWVWVQRHRPVTLSARGMKGAFGSDWSIAWSGCKVIDGGARCVIAPDEDVEVGAVFSGTPE
ncbi:MAG: hypothetical protein KF842_05610 [Caulobacter sp.]|nr:hypothetical protein [Caulobacter sp.]